MRTHFFLQLVAGVSHHHFVAGNRSAQPIRQQQRTRLRPEVRIIRDAGPRFRSGPGSSARSPRAFRHALAPAW